MAIDKTLQEELNTIEAELERLRGRDYLSPAEQQQVWSLLLRHEILARARLQLADRNWGSHPAQFWWKNFM